MSGSKADRVLEDWRAVAQTVRRPAPRWGVAVRSTLRFTMGTTVVAALLLAAVIVSQRLPATGPGGPSPVVPGESSAADASASPSASASASPPAVIEAHVVATIPVGGYLTGCSVEPAVTEGALWVLRGGSVIKVDTNSSQIVAEIPAGLGSSLQIASGMGAVWVAPGYCETGTPPGPMMLKRIDPATNEIVASIPFDAPGFLSTSDVGVWVTIGTDPLTTYRIDAATNEPQSGFEVPVAPIGACGELWTWTGKSDGTGTETFISRIDPNSGNAASTFTVEAPNVGSIYGVGDECWALIAIETPEPVVPWPTYLVRIDPERGFVERSPDLPSAAFELGGSIWLGSTDATTQTITIQRIDPRTGDGLGPSWILPEEVGAGGLVYAGGSVWAQLGPSTIVQLDIKVDD